MEASRRRTSPRNKKPITTTTSTSRIKTSAAPATTLTIGEAIQQATTAQDLLTVAGSRLWLSTDPDLAPHLRTQRIHHEKRQRWSSQLLYKLGSYHVVDWKNDERLARAVLAAAVKFDDDDQAEREGRHLREALLGLHALAGKSHQLRATAAGQQQEHVHIDICTGIATLIDRVEGIAQDVSLSQAIELRWAARGLLTRIRGVQEILVGGVLKEDGAESGGRVVATQKQLTRIIPNLERRVSRLPFDIIPLGVDWSNVIATKEENVTAARTLRDAIPFQFDTIVTRSGSCVKERRGTAWVAEHGIGALAYSGKLMPPRPMPRVVREIMRHVETNTMDTDVDDGPYFDCALCNHYPNGETACKFHTDPEHGLVWERLTCVVAAGEERRFAFRPIPGISTWNEWDDAKSTRTMDEETMPAAIYLFPGDVVKMWGTCNDCFHHAVYTAKEREHHVAEGDDGRVSLVLKRAIRRGGGGGKRGHGLEGRGRRAQRRSRSDR